jgi:hypothetical protein
MRVLGVTLAVLLLASATLADDPPKQDYSRDALLRFAASNDIKMSPLPEHLPPGRIQWHIGWMEFRALGMEWRIVYLPITMPLAGSGMQDVASVPNALEQTGNAFPARSQLFADRSKGVNREMKRVLKLERQAKVKADR